MSAVLVEGFAVETADGMIFTVKGLQQPPDRVIAYLRYLPDPAGERQRGTVAYRRVYRFEEQQEILRSCRPQALVRDPVLGLEVQSVARDEVAVVHDPVAFLARLRRGGPRDPVEQDGLALAGMIQAGAGVAWESLGISGSLMLGTQRPESDLDLLVYGRQAGLAVHRALGELLDQAGGPLQRPGRAALRELYRAHRPETPLSFEQFCWSQGRKVNESRFRGRPVFVRFVPRPAEMGLRYGDCSYRPLGPSRLRARVIEDRWGIFTPCVYGLAEVRVLEGGPAEMVREIVSHRGRFADQVRADEGCEAVGVLEQVLPLEGEPYQRLVIGGRAGDYLRAERSE